MEPDYWYEKTSNHAPHHGCVSSSQGMFGIGEYALSCAKFLYFVQILFTSEYIGKYQKPYNPPTLSTKAQDLLSLKVQF